MRDRGADDDELTVRDASDELLVSMATVYSWIGQGRIPVRRTEGGRFRISRDDLDQIKVVVVPFKEWLAESATRILEVSAR